MPGEKMETAIRRRAEYELGITMLEGITCVLPKYVYKTPPFRGIIEHEFCPVYVAFTDQEPTPNDQEVDAYAWVTLGEYEKPVKADRTTDTMSYWAKDQFPRITAQVRALLE